MNKFNESEFFTWLEETFVTNRFSRDIIVNLIGYGLQEKNNAKDQFISFISDIIPDVSMYDVAMFCSHDMLTGGTLEAIKNHSLFQEEHTNHKNILVRELNVDGCGGNAEVFLHFPDEISVEEISILENAMQESAMSAVTLYNTSGECFDTNSIVDQGLEIFRNITGKTPVQEDLAIIEFRSEVN